MSKRIRRRNKRMRWKARRPLAEKPTVRYNKDMEAPKFPVYKPIEGEVAPWVAVPKRLTWWERFLRWLTQ